MHSCCILGSARALSAAVGCGFYYSSLNWFVAHKSEEKLTALRLVDAFVTTYSSLRVAIRRERAGPGDVSRPFHRSLRQTTGAATTSSVCAGSAVPAAKSRPRRPTPRWRRPSKLSPLEAQPKPKSEFLTADGQVLFRTVYPSFAREESCVACHNELQPGAHWRLNDLMGAFAIDVPASPFLRTNLLQSAGLGLACSSRSGSSAWSSRASIFVKSPSARRPRPRSDARANSSTPSSRTFPQWSPSRTSTARTTCSPIARPKSLFGMSREDIVGKRLHDVFPQETADLLRARDCEAMESGGLAIVDEQDVRMADEATRIFNTKKLLIPGEAGAPRYLLTLSEDITQRKQAEAQIAFMARHDALDASAEPRGILGATDGRAGAGAFERRKLRRRSASTLTASRRSMTFSDIRSGDALLREVSKRLQARGRGGDRRADRRRRIHSDLDRRTADRDGGGARRPAARSFRCRLRGRGAAAAHRPQHRDRDLPDRRRRRDGVDRQRRRGALSGQGRRPRQDQLLRHRHGHAAARTARAAARIAFGVAAQRVQPRLPATSRR